jgi:hypothetical protein
MCEEHAGTVAHLLLVRHPSKPTKVPFFRLLGPQAEESDGAANDTSLGLPKPFEKAAVHAAQRSIGK